MLRSWSLPAKRLDGLIEMDYIADISDFFCLFLFYSPSFIVDFTTF